MWPLCVCSQKHKVRESRIISWRGKAALALLCYFSCEDQPGRQWLLGILSELRTGFCGAGEQMITEFLQLGQPQPCSCCTLLCQSSFPAHGLSQCTQRISRLWVLLSARLFPNFCQGRRNCRPLGPGEIHYQPSVKLLRVPGCAAQARGLWLLEKVICPSREEWRWICTSVIFLLPG